MNRWRYCCPECQSHSIIKRVSKGDFRCDVCQSIFDRRYDKKQNQLETGNEDENVGTATKVMPDA